MKKIFYGKMAWSGIRKNKRLYTPYILTCIGMVMMFYIVSFLSVCDALKSMPGGPAVQEMLRLGVGVIGVFALIFLFYTNSFLTRRRKKEFGLYNILGMGKWNLGRILIWESLITGLIALGVGLIAGIVFSKLAELCMVNLLRTETDFSMSVNMESVIQTIKLFAVIFLLILLNTLRQIHLSNPVELLHSENTGEKPPKANWVLALIGAVILGAAYFIALSIENPAEALLWFFVAVIMVIVATYVLFVAGSVTVCRLLQKNKHYYYQTNHFVSVSSMVYRMKRNGAGLASICILCTMVLVMLSSTACLYIGAEDSLRTRYPRNINVDASVDSLAQLESGEMDTVRQMALSSVNESGMNPENVLDYRISALAGYIENGSVIIDEATVNLFSLNNYSHIWQLFFVPLEDYNMMMGQNETLENGEVLVYTTKTAFSGDRLTFEGMEPMKVKKVVSDFVDNGMDAMQIIPSMYIFVPDYYNTIAPFAQLKNAEGESILEYHWLYGFDLDGSDETQIQVQNRLDALLREKSLESPDVSVYYAQVEGAAKVRGDFYGLYGGLFFLGILLGIVFVFAAVLIMYYKQISEGYEDQSRFEIMQKVGMTKRDIKKSINSQVLMVFFLPLVMAGVHLAFAFPMIYKMLILFNLTNMRLFIVVTFGCLLIFALFYVIVYRMTSKAYYNIVSSSI